MENNENSNGGLKLLTSCKFCEFRNGVNCELDFLKEDNHKIETEENGDSYPILNKFCMYRRPNGWKEHHIERHEKGESYKQIARSELRLPISLLVFVPPNTQEKELKRFVQDVNQMTKKPDLVIFMNHSDVKPLFFFLDAGCEFKWSSEQIIYDKNLPIQQLRDEAEILCSKKVETTYFMTVDSFVSLREDILVKLEEFLIDKEQDFILIDNDEVGLPKVYQSKVFRRLSGHHTSHCTEKLEILGKRQKCKNMLKKMKKILQ